MYEIGYCYPSSFQDPIWSRVVTPNKVLGIKGRLCPSATQSIQSGYGAAYRSASDGIFFPASISDARSSLLITGQPWLPLARSLENFSRIFCRFFNEQFHVWASQAEQIMCEIEK